MVRNNYRNRTLKLNCTFADFLQFISTGLELKHCPSQPEVSVGVHCLHQNLPVPYCNQSLVNSLQTGSNGPHHPVARCCRTGPGTPTSGSSRRPKAGNLKQSSVQVHIASMLAKLGVACKPVGALSRAVRGAIA